MALSDDENDSKEMDTMPQKSYYRKIIDSDSSDDEKSEVKDPEEKLSVEKNLKGNKGTRQLLSDSSDDEDNNKSATSVKIDESLEKNQNIQDPVKSSKAKLYDSDTSEDEHQKSLDFGINESNYSRKQRLVNSDSDEEPQVKSTKKDRRKGVPKKFDKKPKEKVQRKSAKAAMETIKDELNIKELSEKAKSERDREIKIPYHKPKQYSLKEFLARKTINKPTVPAVPQESKPTILKMKMNTEDLEKFAQKMKEREQEAIEFFKSESEDEETENTVEPTEKNEHVSTENNEIICESPKDTNEVQISEEKSESFQEMDTEKVQGEEPQQITPEEPQQDPTDKENICNEIKSPIKKQRELSALRTLEEISAKNGVIDLMTGDIKPKDLKGPDLLFNRYLKTISKPKPKDTICMNILSVEDGKIENQRVEVKLDKKLELDHNRPGFSHELLKEQLRNKVMQKRLEEVRKKSLQKPEPVELEPEDKCKSEEIQESAKIESDDDDYEPENESDEMDSEEEIISKEKKKEKCDFVDDEVSHQNL